MSKFETRDTLQHLIDAFPKPQYFRDFSVSKEEKQSFLNFLFELHQMELIEGSFVISRSCESAGLPIDFSGVRITKKGREFMRGENENASIVQNISVHSVPGNINIAGRDISISNEAQSEELVKLLLENIEKSNLEPEVKKNLTDSFSNMFKTTTPGVIAGLIVESVKSIMQ